MGIRGYGALQDKNSMKRLCRRADRVICCSKVMADDVKTQFGAKDVVCVYNPCDVESIRRLAKEPLLADSQKFLTKAHRLWQPWDESTMSRDSGT